MTKDLNRISRPRWGRPALLALLLLSLPIHAQDSPNRFLFVFDTSSDMKDRIKAEQFEITQLLVTSMNGELHAGDSIGVWTFDQTLHAGQFPLATWSPDNASEIADSLNKFLREQHYSKATGFAALQPVLNTVIKSSPRLTVIIFSDGEDSINWTPYNDGINQMFAQRKANQTKARQPFILVLRSQLGQYIGCTMNFPPGMLNLPDFPPLPQPPPVQAAPAPAPVPEPAPPAVKPLIMIGTNILDHEPPLEPVTQYVPPPKPTNTPPVVTNTLVVTNTIVLTNVVATTKPAVPPASSTFDRKGALALGVGLLIAAAGLITLAVSRSRQKDSSSLITRSMRKD
jgi:hypothetical protein